MTVRRITWTITMGDQVWHEDDLTLGQAALFQDLTGEDWPRNPNKSATVLLSLLAVLLSGGDPAKQDDALGQVAGLTMVEALGFVEFSEASVEG